MILCDLTVGTLACLDVRLFYNIKVMFVKYIMSNMIYNDTSIVMKVSVMIVIVIV